MQHFIVERTFDPAMTADELAAIEERMAPCLAAYDVCWVRSYWSSDRRRMICEYTAPDAESVRKVQREAAARFDVVWPAEVLE